MTGLGSLLRVFLRRDRVTIALWAGFLALMVIGSATRYRQLFGAEGERDSFSQAVEQNRVLGAFGGQLFTHELGGLVHFKIGSTLYSLIALCALLAVIRHTRDDEEQGRLELYRAGAVHPLAPLLSAWLAAVVSAGIIAVLCSAAVIASKLPTGGALALGLTVFGQGLLYASIAAVTAQLTASARTARLLAGLVLGVSYTVRFLSDGIAMPSLHWASFEGWAHEVRPFAGDRLGVAMLPIVLGVALLALAVVLNGRRDLGEGLLPARPGSARGERLDGALGLAWRLQRGSLLAWCVGYGALGLILGSLTRSIPDVLDRAGQLAQEFFRRYSTPDGSLADAYVWLVLASLGYIVSLFAVLSVLRLRHEEINGNAELLLSAPLSRTRWATSHLILSFGGSALILLVTGLTFGLAQGEFLRTLGAASVLIPAVWTLSGFTIAAVGIVPRWSIALGWGVVLYVNTFGEIIGPALGIEWDKADAFVPFHWVPKVMSGEFSLLPVAALVAVAAGLTVVGLARLRKRDTLAG